tara:strand:- start:179 stop:703 length:525 start_codon:yes stop_codon:yes gene_type:complete
MDDGERMAELASSVIHTMCQIPQLNHLPIEELEEIPLGKLRRNATRTHGICRYKSVKDDDGGVVRVARCIDLHPHILTDEWSRYAEFVLYHEFLHALGYMSHNKEFRNMEALWPDEESRDMGKAFGKSVREINPPKWLLTCPQCGKEYARYKKGNGRYRCRNCRVVLVDIRAER